MEFGKVRKHLSIIDLQAAHAGPMQGSHFLPKDLARVSVVLSYRITEKKRKTSRSESNSNAIVIQDTDLFIPW